MTRVKRIMQRIPPPNSYSQVKKGLPKLTSAKGSARESPRRKSSFSTGLSTGRRVFPGIQFYDHVQNVHQELSSYDSRETWCLLSLPVYRSTIKEQHDPKTFQYFIKSLGLILPRQFNDENRISDFCWADSSAHSLDFGKPLHTPKREFSYFLGKVFIKGAASLL